MVGDDEQASFYARLVIDYEPEELDLGLDPEDQILVFAYGEWPGQFIEVDQLETAMADEVAWSRLPEDLVAAARVAAIRGAASEA